MQDNIHETNTDNNNYREPHYNIGSLPLYIVRKNIDSYPERKTCSHWNSGMETIYIQSGSLLITVNGVQSVLQQNDICIIDAGCVHYFEGIENQSCIYFRGIVDESLFCSLDSIVAKYIIPVFHSFHPNIEIITSDSPYNKKLKKIFQLIYSLAQNKPPAYELYIISAFHKYLALICEALKDSFFIASKLDSKTDISMREMLSYIHSNYSKPIRIEDLCVAGIVSRNQCFQLFTKYTGDTPANFIVKYRLMMAQKYLSSSALSISEIATICGFTHQSHFTNHFTKQYGLTPLQYRKRKHRHITKTTDNE